MSKIGLIDVDGHNFPNLPLMKISAWHKKQGDTVEKYEPLFSGHMERVYMSKVFSFTPDYEYYIDADEIIKGGSGYCIELENGKEIYHSENDVELLAEIEHIYPDYSIYPELTKNTAYGFVSRGCPRGCEFCHVGAKEGRKSYKVADLSEFWKGQKNIVLLDPNLVACKEWKNILQQLIDSKAWVDFSQGVDIAIVKHSSWISDFNSDWVPEDKKIHYPETQNTYIAYVNENNEWIFMDEEGNENICDKEFGIDMERVYDVVTHWQPLPESYKGEEAAG